jgi:hypothetical protein
MSVSYADRTFRSVSNSNGGDVGSETIFDYAVDRRDAG